MPWKISSRIQILFLSFIGVYRTINEFYNQNLEEVWQLELSDSLSPFQNLITSVISGIILIREFTGHLYIASYFLILYPIIMGKMRSALLLWMLVSGLRSILLNLGVAIIGIVLCATRQDYNFACFKFVAEEALELGCSIYMWTVVNDYYHSLKKITVRSHFQSPLDSPNTSQIVEDTSSSFLTDEWSLPLSLVEEFQKSTKENLLESATKTTSDSAKNLKSRSVDSLLAQAMVDWFIKKIVKFKPKVENENSSPTKLSDMNSNDVATLRKRIKKSIADIDKNDIKDLLDSNSSVKDQKGHENTRFLNLAQGTEEKVERIVNQEDSGQGSILKDIPKGVTCRNKNVSSYGESDQIPDLINKINMGQLNVTNCYILNQSNKNLFENNTVADKNINNNKLPLEPSNAINLVKLLFEDSLENTIEKTKIDIMENNSSCSMIYKDVSQTDCNNYAKDKVKQGTNLNTDLIKNVSSIDCNEKALDCSIVIVKSLLEDVIDNATDNRHSILKKDKAEVDSDVDLYQAKSSIGRFEDRRTIKTPLKDLNMDCKKRAGLQKKISFLDDIQNSPTMDCAKIPSFKMSFESGFRNNFDDFPERVRSVLKSVNMERISRKTDKQWKTKKPYNKENEYNNRFNYKKKDKITNDQEMSIKALRYHFRRCNPTKVPIKRSKETILSQKSLKTIIDGIKLSDKQKIKSSDVPGSSGVQYSQNSLYKVCSPNFKNLNKLKDTSAQTITTRQLLSKIREAEEEDDIMT